MLEDAAIIVTLISKIMGRAGDVWRAKRPLGRPRPKMCGQNLDGFEYIRNRRRGVVVAVEGLKFRFLIYGPQPYLQN